MIHIYYYIIIGSLYGLIWIIGMPYGSAITPPPSINEGKHASLTHAAKQHTAVG